jgi:hypothetical protein
LLVYSASRFLRVFAVLAENVTDAREHAYTCSAMF